MSVCDPAELGSRAQTLTQQLSGLIVAVKGCADRCGSAALVGRLESSTQELGKCSVALVQAAGGLQRAPEDRTLRSDLDEQVAAVGNRLLGLLHALHQSAKGTQACIGADAAVSAIVADLNTVTMFATAGTLRPDSDTDTFGNHRESVLRTAKTLVEDTKALVAGSNSDQEALATGVQTSVRTLTRLSEAVKLGAASLGAEQPDAQVLLINAAKDVAAALADLIGAVKLVAAGRDAALLRESAKNMVTNVQSLLKTVKTVEDEAARGSRAIESAVEAICQEVRLYSSYVSGAAGLETGDRDG